MFKQYVEEAKKLETSNKFKKVMEEFAAGSLKSSNGDVVTDRKQALAIAYSEARGVLKK